MRKPDRWRAAGLARGLAAGALLAAGCTNGSYGVTAWFEDDELRARARAIEVALVTGCGRLGQTGEEPVDPVLTLRFRVGEPSGSLGAAAPGSYGLLVRARDASCVVIAAGCEDVVLEAGGTGELRVPLSVVDGPGCGPVDRCRDGLCESQATDGDGDLDGDGDSDAELDADLDGDRDGETDLDGDLDPDADEVDPPCRTDEDCRDSDPCTIDRCARSACVHEVPSAAGIALAPISPGVVRVTVDLGGPGLDPGRIHCLSSRDIRTLVAHDFDDHTLGAFTMYEDGGTVSLVGEADLQAPSSGAGVRLCGPGAGIDLRAELSTVSSRLAGLSFWTRSEDLGAGEYLVVDYSLDDGVGWSSFALFGDGTGGSGWARHSLLLPEDAFSVPHVFVSFWRQSGTACADLDEVVLAALPGGGLVTDLLAADFDGGSLAPFTAEPPGTGAVRLTGSGGNQTVQLTGNSDAFIWASADASALEPMPTALLVAAWRWQWLVYPVGEDEYVLAEYSVDGAASWRPMGAIGLYGDSGGYRRQGALLFPDGWYAPDLRIRFRAAAESSTSATHGARIDDVVVSVIRPELDDVFSPFVETGSGQYEATVTTSALWGRRDLVCAFACGETELWSATVDLRF